MKKHRHGITVALASLSAATASIVGGAIVSQQAVADTDSPAKATVTVVTAGTDGDAFACTFDDLVLPAPSVIDAVDGDGAVHGTGIIAGGGITPLAEPLPGVQVDGDVVLSGEVTPLGAEDIREGTAEECAAVRADEPGPGAATGPAMATHAVEPAAGGR